MMQLADNIPGQPHRCAAEIGAWADGRLVQWRYDNPEATDADWQGCSYQGSGGVSMTHAPLCLAQGIDMHAAAETELARIWTKVDVIRAEQGAKPRHSPLPQ